MKKVRSDSSGRTSVTQKPSRTTRDAKVQAEFEHYVAHAVADSTRRAYAGDLRHFRDWGGRVPATLAMVARYL